MKTSCLAQMVARSKAKAIKAAKSHAEHHAERELFCALDPAYSKRAKAVFWNVTRFSYSKDDFVEIFNTLDANHWNERRAFSVLWNDGCFKHRDRSDAPFLLDLMYRIKCLVELFSRNAERCLEGWAKVVIEKYDPKVWKRLEKLSKIVNNKL